MTMPFKAFTALVLAGALGSVVCGGGTAHAEDVRFAVVDLEPRTDVEKLHGEIEREVARLRPGAVAIDDPAMRRLLATGEGPADAAQRVLRDMKRASAAGDCDTAIAKGREAEGMILNTLSIDEEREPLKALYIIQVVCEAKRGRAAELATAASRLRALVAMAPTDLPPELWEKYVANAVPTAAQATVELVIDSDPANASIAVNLHGEGVTPHTMKVAPGVAFVEIQKEGYKKAFRSVVVRDRPARAVLRLIPRSLDRIELAEAQLRLLRRANLKEETPALSRLSQLVRVETLVLYKSVGNRVTIWFFDAERGALTEAPIESSFDLATGKVAALAGRGPAGGGAGKPATTAASPSGGSTPAPTAALPILPSGAPPADKKGEDERAAQTPLFGPNGKTDVPAPETRASDDQGLPEAKASKQQAQYVARKQKPGAPWWSWLIAGAVGAGFLTFMWADRTQSATSVKVQANWPGGQ
jgi:hypothetical protein